MSMVFQPSGIIDSSLKLNESNLLAINIRWEVFKNIIIKSTYFLLSFFNAHWNVKRYNMTFLHALAIPTLKRKYEAIENYIK